MVKHMVWALALCFLSTLNATAQPPAGDEEGATAREEGGRTNRRRGRTTEAERPIDGEEDRGEGGRPDRERGRLGRGNPMFDVLDTDGDQIITARELKKAIAQLKTLDADGDGNITIAEASPQRGPGRFGGPGGDPDAMIDQMFERHDANGDGKLTPDEVDERLAGMLRGADVNGDGAVDREELAAAMENMRGRFGRGGGPGLGAPGGIGDFGGGPGGPGGPGRGGLDPEAMVGRMMQFDANGDGVLSPDELPEQAVNSLRGADADGNGRIDAKELRMAAERMGRRGRAGFGRGDQGGPADDEEAAGEGVRRPGRGQRQGQGKPKDE